MTRDDLKWSIGIVAAVIVGLATLGTSITDYGIPASWLPLIRLGALIVGIVSGKLATSPLPGKVDADTVRVPRSVPLVLVALVLGGTLVAGCASAHQTAIVIDQSFATAVFNLDDAEYQACQTGTLTVAQCAALNGPITKALEDVKAVSLAIKATPTGVPHSLPVLLIDL